VPGLGRNAHDEQRHKDTKAAGRAQSDPDAKANKQIEVVHLLNAKLT
jgi:hypothetical protein